MVVTMLWQIQQENFDRDLNSVRTRPGLQAHPETTGVTITNVWGRIGRPWGALTRKGALKNPCKITVQLRSILGKSPLPVCRPLQ